MAIPLLKEADFRYERKFLISDLTKHQVEFIIKMHPAMFSEIYEPRFVNNIYFDSYDLRNYFENIDGSEYRMKTRIRWYGDLFGVVASPVLECKVKSGVLCKKLSVALNQLKIDENMEFDKVRECVQRSDITEILKLTFMTLVPSVGNRYFRKYYQSADGNYRITVDTEMMYYGVSKHNNSFVHKHSDDTNTILEIKYATNYDDNVQSISKYLPVRVAKNSKYVHAVEALYSF